jgi:hypothetical protein
MANKAPDMAPSSLDPLRVVWESLQSLFVRMVLLGTTTIVGGISGVLIPCPIGIDHYLTSIAIALTILPATWVAAIVLLTITESNRRVCIALGVNFFVWLCAGNLLLHPLAIA